MAGHSRVIEIEMRRFLRGFASGSWKTAYDAYRALYRMGPAAIPSLEHQLGQSDWTDLKNREATTLVTALVSLLRDIDEPRSDRAIDGIIDGGCHAAVASSLKSLQRYRNADFRLYDSAGIAVFEAREIDADQRIGDHLAGWLEHVPSGDLREIERMYIVKRHETMDYAGQYMPILSTIVIAWSRPVANFFPIPTISTLLKQSTLYHEIGHHVHRHDFGQDPEQEKEANRYAARLMAKAHPILAPLVRAVRWILKIVGRGCQPAR